MANSWDEFSRILTKKILIEKNQKKCVYFFRVHKKLKYTGSCTLLLKNKKIIWRFRWNQKLHYVILAYNPHQWMGTLYFREKKEIFYLKEDSLLSTTDMKVFFYQQLGKKSSHLLQINFYPERLIIVIEYGTIIIDF